jgi:hypothetical protein
VAHIFSLMCSSIVGGFMVRGPGVVKHYYVLSRVRVRLAAACATPDSPPIRIRNPLLS